eukprot:TRINITY_DN25263_c0_g2_i1.p1 TRINITY_DN25263_c0_g2~~TRINITY_DN25263_c0_g2_i1.p1  ORF type:complete len:621 (+),score=91.18 TRINITY_DN25263_c0_g2_i1:53-1915(+)
MQSNNETSPLVALSSGRDHVAQCCIARNKREVREMPVLPAVPRDNTVAEVQEAIDLVASKAAEWAALPPAQKRALFEECLAILKDNAICVEAAACKTRGYEFNCDEEDHLVADAAVLSGVLTASWLNGAIALFESLETTGAPPKCGLVTSRPDGTSRLRVFPAGIKESLMGDTGRWTAVPLGEGGAFDLVVRGAVEQFNPLDAAASVTGVLGAGNTEILNDIVDPLCKLNSVVVYKANPVMSQSNAMKQRILAPLIQKGYLAFVYGGAEQGEAIVRSAKVARILMTGSHHTFDRIVWGKRNKVSTSVEPIVNKPVLAELGSVNPYIVVPGDAAWSASDIEYQAEALVAYKLVNNAHVCAAPQVIVTCRRWPQRDEFLAAVRGKMAAAPSTCCFYPGIQKQYDKHLAAMGAKAIVGTPSESTQSGKGTALSLALLTDIEKPTGSGHQGLALQDEAFCPILYEISLDTASNLDAFLPVAVEFCHTSCWGNLTCMVIVDDETKAAHQEKLDEVVDSMRFGTIGINFPASAANAFPALVWGAFPGNSIRDVQSGIGQLGNFFCYQHVEKSVLTNRFRNLHSFRLACTTAQKRDARKRAERIAAVFTHMTYWRIIKFASAEFLGI